MQRWLRQKNFFLCLAALVTLSSVVARAAERFPRPIFTKDRRFLVSTTQEASILKDRDIPFDIIFFDRASQSCNLSHEEALGKLRTMFNSQNALWRSLDRLFPHSRERLENRQIQIFIDDFTEFAGERPDFASYFVTIENHPIIGLSCSSLFRSYWLPSLAHEFTHALLEGTNSESWWEEGLAQNIEADIGGEQPSLTLKHLRNFPELLEKRRPLPSKESYAMNQLFVRYLKKQFGGWPTLQAMSGTGEGPAPRQCESEKNFLSKLACRGKVFLESSSFVSINREIFLGADKMTRVGLLRYFAVALTLNDNNIAKYNIPEWPGMPLPQGPSLSLLQAGQFIAWQDPRALSISTINLKFNSKLELYRILSDNAGHFVILPKAQVTDAKSLAEAKQKLNSIKKDFFLLLNTEFTSENVN